MESKHKVFVPRDFSSLSMGADEVADAIRNEAKRRGIKLDLVRNGSRGMYWLEPLVEVQTSGGRIGYRNVSPEEVPSIFDAFLDNKNHPLYIGFVDEIDYLKRQTRLTFERVGLIDPLSIDEYVQHGGFSALKKALSMESKDIINEIKMSGLRGRGGAGFPTGVKWETVFKTPSDEKYVVCNADEGDSGTFSDRMIMECDPFLLIEGMIIAGLAVGAKEGYIYLRSEYPLARNVLQKAIDTAYERGYLGKDIMGSGKAFDIELYVGAGAYICGEETALLESLEGKRGIVRPRPPVPAVSGLWGKPTIVNNVVTIATVPWIIREGAQKYSSYGTERSKGTLPVQLSGNVKRGGLVEVPFGITLRELIYEFGEGTYTGRPVKAVQVGGPLGAYLSESMLDVPLDYEAFQKIGGILGHGGVVVFDDTVDLWYMARFAMEFCAHESCSKCTPCRIGSQRGMELIDRLMKNGKDGRLLTLLEDLMEVMMYTSLCGLGGMAPYPVLSILKHFSEELGLRKEFKFNS
ncbi:MAG: NADH-quinone oxidoreductase subunit NuoF [Hydrogenobacter sp.]|uniref:formate dehydrogenase beta subunit n=1 Tax=Hydrogenobacter thermophilus TaxID=940 RepID=UPI0030FC1941